METRTLVTTTMTTTTRTCAMDDARVLCGPHGVPECRAASGLNQGTLSPNQCYVKILSAFCSRATN